MSLKEKFLGPKVPEAVLNEHRLRFRRPTACFVAAMLALVLSLFFPYWLLELSAPQFPNGLRVSAYVNRLVGDVDPVTQTDHLVELDNLNHYVGMPSLQDGAQLERTVAVAAILVFAGLLLAAVYVHSRWVVLFALPALLFPFVFLADLQYWLWNYGHSLDPRAPLAGAVGEFTPRLFGPSEIAQFDTMALPGPGLVLAAVAALLAALGLWFHRKAYRPLIVEAEAGEADGEADGAVDPGDAVDGRDPGPAAAAP